MLGTIGQNWDLLALFSIGFYFSKWIDKEVERRDFLWSCGFDENFEISCRFGVGSDFADYCLGEWNQH